MDTTESDTKDENTTSTKNTSNQDQFRSEKVEEDEETTQELKITLQALIKMLGYLYNEQEVSICFTSDPNNILLEINDQLNDENQSATGECFYDMEYKLAYNISDTWYSALCWMIEDIQDHQNNHDNMDDEMWERVVREREEIADGKDGDDSEYQDLEGENLIVAPGYDFLRKGRRW